MVKTLERAKELQEYLNNNIKELRKGNKTQEQKKRHQQVLIFFLMEEIRLLNFMMIILQNSSFNIKEMAVEEQSGTGFEILSTFLLSTLNK